MADLIETPVWEPGIYQIEQTDPVVGGAPDLPTKQGVTNIPAQQLGNRTAYLLAQIQILQAALGNIDVSAQINAAITALIDGAPGALDTLNELAAAIGDNDSELAALLAQIAALSAQVDAAGAPIGQIAAFHADVPPAGWVVCDGSPVTALFPDLRAHLLAQPGVQTDGGGDPLLPDYRGEFLRGLDLGRGVDPGRVLGSAQADEFKSHTHSHWASTGGSGAMRLRDDTGSQRGPYQSGATGGTETRPRNIAALICMKAASQAVTAGMADLSALLTAIATQVQAEQGVNTTALMTPLRTKQAIEAMPNGLGVGQVAQNVTGSRATNTTYQNASGKPIFVIVRPSAAGANRNFQVSTDAANWVSMSVSGGAEAYTQSCVVPVGQFYRFTGAFGHWMEVR